MHITEVLEVLRITDILQVLRITDKPEVFRIMGIPSKSHIKEQQTSGEQVLQTQLSPRSLHFRPTGIADRMVPISVRFWRLATMPLAKDRSAFLEPVLRIMIVISN